MPVKIYKSLRIKIITVIMTTLILMVGGSYYYIISEQSKQFVETIKEQSQILTHAIVKSIQHDMRGTCQKDIQGIFERIGILPEIESLRIFDENGQVSKSADQEEVGLTIEDIGYEIFKANIPSTPYLGGHGYNAFCMVERITKDESCLLCHKSKAPVIGIFELCLSMEKTDKKIAENRRFLMISAMTTILLIAVILSLFITIQVNRPIEKLVKVMHQAEAGDMDARANIHQDDELGLLSSSFDAMIQRLDETQKEVEHYHTKQLIRADRLATMGELAAGVAHEIKNPLAGISGAVQVLADDFDSGDPRRIITEQIIKQTERMDKTIRDLLNFAQPLEPELRKVNVNEVLDNSLFICLPNPDSSNIQVERSYAAGLPPLITDAKHIQQVFINVILNAVQAMLEGGTLTIATSLRAGKADEHDAAPACGESIRVKISDTGPGISSEVTDKIFNPFCTTKIEGTGLGLSITKRILEMHRASISYKSKDDKGTTFIIDLPLDSKEDKAEK